MTGGKTLSQNILSVYNKNKDISRQIIIIIGIFILMSLIAPGKFWTPAVFNSILGQFPEFGILSFAMAITMITGGIDLSIVGISTVSSMVSAKLLLGLIPMQDAMLSQQVSGILIAIIASLVIGMAAGLLNGLLIAKINVPPILATIGTLQMFTGLAIVLSEAKSISGMPTVYSEVMTQNLFSMIPLTAILLIMIALAMWLILARTPFGLKVYMLGSNANAAKFSGLRNDRIIVMVYMISGILSSIAGLVMLANYNSVRVGYGEAYTLQCVLIAVLGGVSPMGGKGSIGGVALAVITLQLLSSSLNMLPGIDSFYKSLIWGALLLLVLMINHFSGRRSTVAG